MYHIPFVDCHLSKVALWCELFGRRIAEYILFRSEESYYG